MSDDLWLYASKLLPLFVYPIGLTIMLMLLSLLSGMLRRRILSRVSLVLALAILWISSTPLVAERLYAELEGRYPPVAVEASPTADVAIILGGAIGQPLAPRTYLDLSDSADRVWHAARLYRAGKVPRIVVSAGNLPWYPAAAPEADLIADLLQEWGVPRQAIFVEGESRNTYENALMTKALLEKEGWTSALLITSAAHMPRALAVFAAAGVAVTPSVTDVEVAGELSSSLFDLLPQMEALALTTAAMKEWVGYAVYRAAGWG